MDKERITKGGNITKHHTRVKPNTKSAKAPHFHEGAAKASAGNEKAKVKKSSVKRHKGTY